MATRSRRHSLKSTQQYFSDAAIDSATSGHTNLNLNHECFNAIRSKRISSDIQRSIKQVKVKDNSEPNKFCLEPRNITYLSNQSDRKLQSEDIIIYDQKKDKNHLKDKCDSATNSSTLSLHIAVYENVIEADGSKRQQNTTNIYKNNDIFKKSWKGAKQFLSRTNNPIEIPRQQKKEEEATEPEVMQFKASQKLCNPDVTVKSEAAEDKKDVLPELLAEKQQPIVKDGN